MRNTHPPLGHRRSLGIELLKGPTGRVFLVREVPLYPANHGGLSLPLRLSPQNSKANSHTNPSTYSGTLPYTRTTYGDFVPGKFNRGDYYDKYSVGPSIRPIYTRCCFEMTNMIQACSNFIEPEYSS